MVKTRVIFLGGGGGGEILINQLFHSPGIWDEYSQRTRVNLFFNSYLSVR